MNEKTEKRFTPTPGPTDELVKVAQRVANLGEYRELVCDMAKVLPLHERDAFIRLFREDARAALRLARGESSNG